MISTSDFRTGLTFELDGDVVTLLEFQHVKPAKAQLLSAASSAI